VAIKFDIFDNSGEGINSTGIFTGGRSPTVRQLGLSPTFPDKSIDLTGTGINLHSGHPFQVTLVYDGTTLTETIKDTVTNVTFTTSYVVNIPDVIVGGVGYMGFTGATGGTTSVQDIQSWTIQTTIPDNNNPNTTSQGGSPSAGGTTPAETVTNTLVGSGGGPLGFTVGTDGQTASPGGGADPSMMVSSGPAAGSSPLAETATLGQVIGIIDPAWIRNGSTGSSPLNGVLQSTYVELVQPGFSLPDVFTALINGVDGGGLASSHASPFSQPLARPHQGINVDVFDQVFSSPDLVGGL
jgi:hypothetical protein